MAWHYALFHLTTGLPIPSPSAVHLLVVQLHHGCLNTQVQMFIGDGAKLVRDAFALAKEKAPCIVFIDEVDAIGTKRFDSELSGDREVQRTMLELLNQLDGFSSDENIKVWLDLHSCSAEVACPCEEPAQRAGSERALEDGRLAEE